MAVLSSLLQVFLAWVPAIATLKSNAAFDRCVCGAGAKNAQQAEEAAGALGWRLTSGECRALEATADRISRKDVAFGMPFEQW